MRFLPARQTFVAHVAGIAASAIVILAAQWFLYREVATDEIEIVDGIQPNLAYRAIRADDLIGLSAVAATKALEKDAKIVAAYEVAKLCNGGQPAVWADGNRPDTHIALHNSIGRQGIFLTVPAAQALSYMRCEDESEFSKLKDVYLLTSSSEVQLELRKQGFETDYVGLPKIKSIKDAKLLWPPTSDENVGREINSTTDDASLKSPKELNVRP